MQVELPIKLDNQAVLQSLADANETLAESEARILESQEKISRLFARMVSESRAVVGADAVTEAPRVASVHDTAPVFDFSSSALFSGAASWSGR